MASVIVGVEADQVAVKYAEQDLVTYRQDTIDLRRGERSVKEEADLDVLLGVTNLLAQHGRHEHQVVVVDPDHIVVLDVLCNSLREQAVGLGVSFPGRLVKGDLSGVVVEKRPHDGVCELLLVWLYYHLACRNVH